MYACYNNIIYLLWKLTIYFSCTFYFLLYFSFNLFLSQIDALFCCVVQTWLSSTIMLAGSCVCFNLTNLKIGSKPITLIPFFVIRVQPDQEQSCLVPIRGLLIPNSRTDHPTCLNYFCYFFKENSFQDLLPFRNLQIQRKPKKEEPKRETDPNKTKTHWLRTKNPIVSSWRKLGSPVLS